MLCPACLALILYALHSEQRALLDHLAASDLTVHISQANATSKQVVREQAVDGLGLASHQTSARPANTPHFQQSHPPKTAQELLLQQRAHLLRQQLPQHAASAFDVPRAMGIRPARSIGFKGLPHASAAGANRAQHGTGAFPGQKQSFGVHT